MLDPGHLFRRRQIVLGFSFTSIPMPQPPPSHPPPAQRGVFYFCWWFLNTALQYVSQRTEAQESELSVRT